MKLLSIRFRHVVLAVLLMLPTSTLAVTHNPVIFLHGWEGSASGWDNMTNLLDSAGWHATGEKKNLFPIEWDELISSATLPIKEHANRVYARIFPILNKNEKVDFVVHSMGGLILRQLLTEDSFPADKVGCVVDLATPHYGQNQKAGAAASDMYYGSTFLWNLAIDWYGVPQYLKNKWLNVAGVTRTREGHSDSSYAYGLYGLYLDQLVGSRKAHDDGLVDQWSTGLLGTTVRYVNKSHANAEIFDPFGDWMKGETIYACGGDDSGQRCDGIATDPVFQLVKTFLASNGNEVYPQSYCGASVPSNEGGGIFLQVVDEHGNPIPWTGKMVAKITSQDGKKVPFEEFSGKDDEARRNGICMLVYPVGTFRGFDPGVYDIEFNPSSKTGSFRWRGIRVESNRPTIVRDSPRDRPMIGICLDHSTSMSANDLASAKANAKRAIDMAPAGTLVGVFAFGSGVETIFNYTEVTDANRSSLKAKIDSISLSGSTALWKAADVALNAMNALDPEHNNIGSLLLLTDGGDNASGSITKASVVSKCLEMGVAFNSISYGSNADANLGAASSETGGRNVSASGSLSSLNDAFSRLLTYGSCRVAITDDKGITSSSGTWSDSFSIDSSLAELQATVTLSVPASSATVYLVSPTGTRYAATSTTTIGSESTFFFRQPTPAAGRWTVSVSAPSGTQTSCYVDSSATKEPPRLSLRVDEENETIYALLASGAPVDGASVRALIQENGTTREVPFAAIGAGAYKLALQNCGTFSNGLTIRADATKGVATYTYVGVMDYTGDGEGSPIPESFTRSEWLDIAYVAPATHWYYSVADGCATITGASPASGNLIVPSTLGGYPVTAIGEWALENCSTLTSVVIPAGVTSIGNSAFHCSGLTSVSIPASVTNIAPGTFSGCVKLSSITIPNGVTSIGTWAFYCCESLTHIEIPQSVRSIDDYAFPWCYGLESITIPCCVTSIGEGAFYECENLRSVSFAEGLTSIADYAFYKCRKLTSLRIPNSVTTIGFNAFGDCHNLTTITLPERFRGKTNNMGIPSGCKVTFSGPKTTYTVKFNANGGTLPKGKKMAAQTMTYGKAAKLRKNVFKAPKGKVFAGWATSKAKAKKGVIAYRNGQSVKNLRTDGKTTTLYAVWAKKTYKVEFCANGGKGKMSVEKFAYGKAKKLSANGFAAPKGKKFAGWAKSKALAQKGKVAYKNKKKVKNLTTTGKTVKLYAVWKKK